MYDRAADGAADAPSAASTPAARAPARPVRFAGDGLGSAHSVQLSQDSRFLFVANAGSDSVSVFRVSRPGAHAHRRGADPRFPNSVTQHGNRVYVLNGGGDGSITGYRLQRRPAHAAPGSDPVARRQPGPPSAPTSLFNPTQVSFTPDGRQLVVTIKDGPAAGLHPRRHPDRPRPRARVRRRRRRPRRRRTSGQTNLNNRGPFGFSFESAPPGRRKDTRAERWGR